jgi:hypothetical protein
MYEFVQTFSQSPRFQDAKTEMAVEPGNMSQEPEAVEEEPRRSPSEETTCDDPEVNTWTKARTQSACMQNFETSHSMFKVYMNWRNFFQSPSIPAVG